MELHNMVERDADEMAFVDIDDVIRAVAVNMSRDDAGDTDDVASLRAWIDKLQDRIESLDNEVLRLNNVLDLGLDDYLAGVVSGMDLGTPINTKMWFNLTWFQGLRYSEESLPRIAKALLDKFVMLYPKEEPPVLWEKLAERDAVWLKRVVSPEDDDVEDSGVF